MTYCRMISLMLLAIIGSNVSIHISPAPVAVYRPTSMKKTLSVEPHLRSKINYQLMNSTPLPSSWRNKKKRTRKKHLPSHVSESELNVLDAGLAGDRCRRSDANQRQRRVGNAQSITANDAVALAQASSDYIHLPDMF